MDYGWYGLAGVFAILLVIASTFGFIVIFDLLTWRAWKQLYASEVLLWILFVLGSLLLAKVLATVVHLIATCWKIRQYRALIQTAVHDQECRQGSRVRKVLICHASVGSGHSRAAQALSSALHRLDASLEVRVVDLMEPPYADRTLIYFYKDWYLRLVGGHTVCGDLGGHFVGFLFDRANNVGDSFTEGNALQRRITQSFLLNFLQLVCEMKPDILVHTHFLSPELVASLRRRHGLKVPQVTVVTDMDVHAWWFQQPTDQYFVPREVAKFQLIADGVPKNDITVSGIPIMPQFQDTLKAVQNLSKRERRLRFLREMDAPLHDTFLPDCDRPVVVQMSTGRSVTHIFKNLITMETPIILVLVCGRQADARKQLEQVEVPQRHRVALLGFTSCIHELLAIADVVISKPGGLITSEVLACGLMMVVVDPYPGQEERNASMLLEEGAGIWIWDYRDAPYRLDRILSSPPESKFSLAWYKQNARRIAKPDAAFKVARYVLSDAPRQRMLVEERGDLESSSTSPNGPPVATQSPTFWTPPPLISSGSIFSEDPLRVRRTSPVRRLSMKDFAQMKVLDANAVPHTGESEDSSDTEDGSETHSYLQVQED
ncbi:2-diacylglycerol-3-beta-D-glucosyltransferase) [Durusdinium trenchii]|uniref:monogalactosyldiacylglycerol synthase n=1 Tax=Durusdinium trenchii TaxID=1381693 RepID=A0ABP0RNA7_9DINO